MFFLQALLTSIGIRALTYPNLMANQEDGDHHNNDDSNDIDNTVLIRIEFLEFHKDARNENNFFFLKRVRKL